MKILSLFVFLKVRNALNIYGNCCMLFNLLYGSFVIFVFLMLSRLFIAALWFHAGKGLTSWLFLVMFIVFLLISHVVKYVRCGT